MILVYIIVLELFKIKLKKYMNKKKLKKIIKNIIKNNQKK
jgi:hypothetical protein